jgi:hypothetical protein
MIEDMRIRNLSPQTQRSYVEQVSRFSRHFGLSPEQLGQDEIRAWQIHRNRRGGTTGFRLDLSPRATVQASRIS